MNQIFNTVWNEHIQSWTVASELAKGRMKGRNSTKKSLLATGLLLGILSTQLISPVMAFTPTVTNQTVNGETVASGSQSVETGGIANDTVVNNGGIQGVNNGGITNGTVLNSSGSQQTVGNNGTSNGTIINDGSWQWITNGGISETTTINAGGEQVIFSGGTANLTTIKADGVQMVHGGAIANGTTILAGGEQRVDVEGIVNNSIINGGKQELLGVSNNATVSNNGNQIVGFRALANDTILNSGGNQTILSGGESRKTVINDGGLQFIQGGGVANATTINAGGEQAIINAGVANGTIINSDGVQTIESGGQANTTTINTGGEQFVNTGGITNNTLINGGRQVLFGSASGTVANAGEIYAGTGSTLSGATLINGTATIGGDLITNTGTLIFTPSTQNTVTTEITGTGNLIKAGAGTLVLNNNHTYTGGTAVAGGRFIVGGEIADSNASISGDVNVLNSGILGGHGQIAGSVTVENGGKISQGNSIGTLTVGDAHFMGGSTFEVRINPDGSNDKLVASNSLGTGTVRIDSDSNLSLLGGAGKWNDSTSYNLIDTDGGVSGTFTQVNSNLAFLTPTVDYTNPNQVNLTMARNNTSFGGIGGTHNEKNTGTGIESLGPDDTIYKQIVGMSKEQANKAYNNLSGEIHASIKTALFENSRYARHAILEHLERSTTQTTPETGHNLWMNAWAHDGHLKDDNNAARLDNKGAGFIVGADVYKNETSTLGAALGYEQSDLKIGGLRNSNADAEAIHLLVYGQTEIGPVELKAGAGYSWFKIDTKRHVAVGNLISQNTADYDAGLAQTFIEGSHTFKINEQFHVTPYAGLLYQHMSTDDFSERGTNAQLHGHSSSDNSASTKLGVKGQWDINAKSKLYANLGWQHRLSNHEPETVFNFSRGNSYNIRGVQSNRDSALIGVGADFELKPNMLVTVGFDGQFGNRATDYGGKVGFTYKF